MESAPWSEPGFHILLTVVFMRYIPEVSKGSGFQVPAGIVFKPGNPFIEKGALLLTDIEDQWMPTAPGP
jgi:hypothetical protein